MKTNLITMTLMCVYMFKLALGNDLIYYIHPRYIIFSIVATLVCSFVVLKTWKYSHEIHSHKEKRSGLLSFLIICTLITAIILPAQGLTATTALKRFNSGSQTITIRKEVKETQPETATNTNQETQVTDIPDEPTAFKTKETVTEKDNSTSTQETGPTKKVSKLMVVPKSNDSGDIFSDLVFNLETSDSLSSFNDTEVELIGFVLIDPTDGISQYHVSRFFIACCTADANPIGIPFEYSGSEYKNDDWVKVNGKLKIVKQDGFEKVIIIPSSIKKVPEPEFPYAYY